MSSDPPHPVANDSDELGHHWGLTPSERLLGLLALLVALALMAALIALFWQPAPPRRVIMSTGTEDGAYHAYGLRYREILARAGVELVLRPSAGAVENLQRLRERRDGVTLALVQGGLAQPGDADKLVSLGAVNYEPLWLFHRADLRQGGIASACRCWPWASRSGGSSLRSTAGACGVASIAGTASCRSSSVRPTGVAVTAPPSCDAWARSRSV